MYIYIFINSKKITLSKLFQYLLPTTKLDTIIEKQLVEQIHFLDVGHTTNVLYEVIKVSLQLFFAHLKLPIISNEIFELSKTFTHQKN
jgi:hypothetical protein